MTHRRRRRGPLGPSVVAAAVLAVLVVVSALGPGGPTRRAGAAPAVGGAVAQDGPGLALVTQSTWSRVGTTFDASVEVRGAPAGARLAVAVHPKVSGRIRFEQSITGEHLGRPLPFDAPEVVLADRFPGPDGVVDVAVPLRTTAEPGAVRLPTAGTPGAYPVSLRLLDADGGVLDQLVTHALVRPSGPDAGGPLGVAVVVPVDVTLAAAGGGSDRATGAEAADDVDPRALRHVDSAVTALGAEPEVPATLAVAPESVDALVALAGGDRTSGRLGTDLLDRLRAVVPGRQVPVASYVPLALGSWTERATSDGDAARYLDEQRQAGRTTLEAGLRTTTSSRTALIDPSVDPTALRWLARHRTTQVVVPEDQLSDVRDTPREAEWALPFAVEDRDGAARPAVMADASLAGRLTATGDPVLDGHLTLANLAVLWGDLPALARGVVIAPPPEQPVAAPTWQVLLRGLAEPTGADPEPATQPFVEAATLDQLFDRLVDGDDPDDLTVQRYRWDEPGPLGDFPAAATRVGGQVASFATMAGADAARPLSLEVLVAGRSGLGPADRAAHLHAAESSLETQLGQVVASEAQRVTLTDPVGTLPLTLENRLPFDVDVNVVMTSDKLVLLDGEVIPAHLPAGTTTRVEIAVESRVTGAFPLDVSVESPDGGLAVTATRFAVRSTTISGVGLALSVGAGLFLLFWWLRHFRSVRRARRLISPNHPTRRAPTPG